MPIYQELVDFDETFRNLKSEPIIINRLMSSTKEEREYIDELIKVKFGNDVISTIPSCQCGQTRGEYCIGETCPKCHDKVKAITSENLEPLLWVQTPQGISKLISPVILTMLNNRFTKARAFSIIKWLMDTNYKPSIALPKLVAKLQSLGLERGYNNFVNHFEEYINILYSVRDLAKSNTPADMEKDRYMLELIRNNMSRILCDYLPLPNKALLVIGQNNAKYWIDPIILEAIDAISMLTSIDVDNVSDKVRENRTARALIKLTEFYQVAEKKIVSTKQGVFRRHVFGSRTYFSARAVISSITRPHKYDQIEIPWAIGITILRPFIINKLLRRGYELNRAIGHIHSSIGRYDQLIDSIIEELIAESRDGKLYCLIHRNPTLLQGSSQRVNFIVKKEPKDPTIGISILIVSAMNADFDGDSRIRYYN